MVIKKDLEARVALLEEQVNAIAAQLIRTTKFAVKNLDENHAVDEWPGF
jgi:hypothetical protein